MASARRIGRWVLMGLGGLVAAVVLLRVGVGVYLGSPSGRAAVAERLSSMIGLPVEVADLDLGTRTSSIKFRILDKSSPNTEVLSVESASADVSFAELVTGRASPNELHLRGVNLTLRVAADGTITTTLPDPPQGSGGGKVPLVTLEGGKLTVRQEGRPEFALSGLSLRAEPAGDRVVLSGSVDDPGWGRWKVAGEVERATNTGWVDLVTDDAPLELDRLRSIPFLSAKVWENIHPHGRGKAVVRLGVGANEAFVYDVRIVPQGAALGVPAAAVTLKEVNGLIQVAAQKVKVTGPDGKGRATAKLAGGNVTVGGTWDYATEPTPPEVDTVAVAVTADRLAVRQLPPEWGLRDLGGQLPGKINLDEGYLSGDANLKLVVHADGRLDSFGGGVGKIEVPVFAGGNAELAVSLGGNGQRLEFNLGQTPPPPPPTRPSGAMRVSQADAAVSSASPERRRGGEANPLADAPGSPGSAAGPASPRVIRVEVTNEQELAALVTFLLLQPKKDPPAPASPTVLDATLTLRDIDLAQFLEQLQAKLPYKVAGRVTVQAKIAVPLGQATTAAGYRLTGTLTSPALTLEGLTVQGFSARVDYQNGKLDLSELRGSIPQPGDPRAAPGTFSGSASAAFDPPGDLTASLVLDRIPLGQVAAAVPGWPVETRGLVTGKAEFRAPSDKLSDPATWVGSATIRSDALTVAGRTAKGLAVTVAVDKGVATVKEGAATIEGIPLTATGTLGLTGKSAFDAAVKTTGTSITDLRRLIPEAELPLPVEGVIETETRVTGTLVPLAFTASGRVRGTKLTLDKSPGNEFDVKWEATEDRLKVSGINAAMFGGTITGSLDYPFDPQKAGAFDVAFKDVDAAQATAFIPGFRVKVTGKVSGKLAGAIPPAKNGEARIGDFDLELTAPKLTVQNFPAERLTGKVSIKKGYLDYLLKGEISGGTIELKRDPEPEKKDLPPGAGSGLRGGRGTLRLNNVDLSRLARDLKLRSLEPLGGRLDLTFGFENDLSSGSGRVFVRGLSWGDEEASPELSGLLLLRDGVFQLTELSGTLARGQLRARARIRLDEPSRNFFQVSVDRADAERLFAPIPGLGEAVRGDVSVVFRGTFGRQLHGSGSVTVARGTVGGAEVTDLRIPFDYATAPGGYGRVAVREATVRSGSGRATGHLTVDWGAGTRVSGQVRFIDVPLRALSPALGENAMLGAGRITGRFDLSGTNVRSADDLTGVLVASLNNTSVKEVPLLRQAVPYLNPIGVTKPFQAGDVRGTLARGVFRVQRLALANPSAQLFAEGTITVQGRLDLDVVAHTGQIGPDVRGLRALGLRLPAFGPVPVTLIRDVSNFVSNRTVRLTITGTTANPVVRVNTAALLSDEAVRFLLTRYVIPVEVAEVLGIGTASGVIGGATGGNRNR